MPPSEAGDTAPERPAPSRWSRMAMLAAYTPGALGLVLAAGSDAIAVAGRHIGLHLLGSIEITEAAIVLLSTSAMLVATLDFHHASVHMLTARLSPENAGRLARVAALFGALLFVLLALGTARLNAELWSGFEQTELLHIPLRWLRALWLLTTIAIAALFLRRAIKGPQA
ncbi:TRAP transporter small permease subunit [Novosphingobium terrae]|uniref:TRAP transporter small permease subunit n=1 Tax=Novosphingobium terrae TaxID=2726189 RepID=UPI00197D2E4D|nr:TRAP transporter small permease subunit [Novosphingobium terrae]